MTNPRQPSKEELLQLAALQAFGLLDEFESAEYTRWFDDAAAPVQDEIVEFQAVLATDEAFLVSEEPPSELRQRVLDEVAEAIENDSHRLAPLARIGSMRSNDVVGRIGLWRSGQFWRAAAFALAAALIVSLYFMTQTFQQSGRMVEYVQTLLEADDKVRKDIGPGYEEFHNNPNCVYRVLRAAEDDFPGYAFVAINEKNISAYVMTIALPQKEGPYTLSIDRDGAARDDLVSLPGSRLIGAGQRIEGQTLVVLLAATWVITNASGDVVLSSA